MDHKRRHVRRIFFYNMAQTIPPYPAENLQFPDMIARTVKQESKLPRGSFGDEL